MTKLSEISSTNKVSVFLGNYVRHLRTGTSAMPSGVHKFPYIYFSGNWCHFPCRQFQNLVQYRPTKILKNHFPA